MKKSTSNHKVCCGDDIVTRTPTTSQSIRIQPAMPDPVKDDVCCGSPPGPASSNLERPGYALCRFVADFIDTPAGVEKEMRKAIPVQALAALIAVVAWNSIDFI